MKMALSDNAFVFSHRQELADALTRGVSGPAAILQFARIVKPSKKTQYDTLTHMQPRKHVTIILRQKIIRIHGPCGMRVHRFVPCLDEGRAHLFDDFHEGTRDVANPKEILV